MANLIETHRIGLNYGPGDLTGLCLCIEKILDNPDLRDEMSSNALRFFKEYGDADKIYGDYVEHVEGLVEGYSRKAI